MNSTPRKICPRGILSNRTFLVRADMYQVGMLRETPCARWDTYDLLDTLFLSHHDNNFPGYIETKELDYQVVVCFHSSHICSQLNMVYSHFHIERQSSKNTFYLDTALHCVFCPGTVSILEDNNGQVDIIHHKNQLHCCNARVQSGDHIWCLRDISNPRHTE